MTTQQIQIEGVKSRSVTFDELTEARVDKYTLHQVYAVAYTQMDAEDAIKTAQLSVHRELANFARDIFIECKADTDKNGRFKGKQEDALKGFLFLCDQEEGKFKKTRQTTKVPRATTQAKADIKAAWLIVTSEGEDLSNWETTSKMRGIAKKEKDLKEAAELLAGEAIIGKQEVESDNVSTKTSTAKDSIKIEGLNPDSALGMELKAFVDNIVNAHNNNPSAESDLALVEKLQSLKGSVSDTVNYIARTFGGVEAA